MSVVPAQVAGVRRIVVCTPPSGAGMIAAAAELLGVDEVWALGGPQAIGFLAYVEQVDKIVGPGNALRERREARGLARRADRPARRPVRGRRARARGRRPAARRARARRAGRARPRRGLPRRRRAWRRPRRSRPSTSCCSATRPRRSPAQVRNAGSVFVGTWSPVPAGDYATGGNHVLPTGGWARSVGGLGLETFLKPVTVQRLTEAGARAASGRRSRRSPRPRACRRTPRRCGDERARARVPAVPLGAADRRGRGARRASTRRRCCASTRTRRRCRCRRRGPARSPARSRASTATRPAATGTLRRAIADYDGVEPENVVLGAGADDLILLCARAFAGPGDRVAVPAAPTYPLYRIAAQLAGRRGRRRRRRCSRSRAGRTTRPARSIRCRTRGRSSSTRRTSSTRARPRCRCSTTA